MDFLVTHWSTLKSAFPMLPKLCKGVHLDDLVIPSAGLLGPRMNPTFDAS